MRFYIGHSGQLVFVDTIQGGLTLGLQQTIRARLGTQLGRRVWRPNYGLDLSPFLLRNLSSGDRARLRTRIRAALADLNPERVVVSLAGAANTLTVEIIL